MPEISVVMPTLGRSAALREVLAGLAHQQPPVAIEILLVVDAAAAPVREASLLGGAGADLPLTVLEAPRPGASAARNAGWKAARSPLVLFLDDDIVPGPALVSEHLHWHRRHPEPEVGVLGAVRWSPRVKVTPFMRWLEMGIQFDYRSIRGAQAGWGRFYTCNASVKRVLLERVGGFDELNFPFGYEDLDLARRMAEHGFTLLYNPHAAGEHLKTETLDGWRRNLRRTALAERRFMTRYPETRPYFYERFQAAVSAPPARGRLARLARWVAPEIPWLGPAVWRSFDRVCLQRLGPEYLAEWESTEALRGEDRGE